ncbi:MAG: transposase [Phycisphaerae bacterium]|nr:transposase [Phycisphaerae bacterium]
MAKRTRKAGTRQPNAARPLTDGPPVGDYRHAASRKNNPPAKIAAEGTVPVIPKAQYAYNPHLPPVLRFDSTGSPDKLPELLAKSRTSPLSDDEARLLAEALRVQEPWLEWTGKREKKWFEVDPVALHIHERISTQAVLKVAARQDVQRSLFADPEQEYHEAVQFYRHDVDWANRLILGDSLQVMSSLARREDLAGKVQMIYMDPPYGIKFASNFQPEVGRRDVKDKEQDLTREPEMVRAYRDTWHLGIHSYLSYLRDRLIVAKELLADTGSIFVQISDENLHRVRSLLDDVFSTASFIGIVVVRKTTGSTADYVPSSCDYLLWYARNREHARFIPVFLKKNPGDEGATGYKFAELRTGERITLSDEVNLQSLPDGASVYAGDNITSQSMGREKGEGAASWFRVSVDGRSFTPGPKARWKTNEQGMQRLLRAERLIGGDRTTMSYKRRLDDFPVTTLSNVWTDTVGQNQLGGEKVYVVQTALKVVERCMAMTTRPGDLVLDPTCGSGTTAFVAEHWGRRWITIDTSRVAVAIARQRLLTAKYDMYKLRGTGFQPVVSKSDAHGEQNHGQDARATNARATEAPDAYEFLPYNPREVSIRYSAYLPHWEQEGATYSVTFRLADSLPRAVLEGWLRERQEIVQRAESTGRPLSDGEQRRLRELHSERVEKYLDTGHGACHLNDERAATIVRDTLSHFDGERYDLVAWCVMPNHVHVIIRPRPGQELAKILHSWKSFTSNEVNKVLGREGTLWQPDSFDHLIRDVDDLECSLQYVLDNPHAAGLMNWPWVGCGTAFQAVKQAGGDGKGTTAARGRTFESKNHGQDARATNADATSTRATSPAAGFIYRTVPHITLKSIAQNVALDPIFAKHEPILDRALAACNAALPKVTPELRARLATELVRKQREEGKRAVTDADRRRWELPQAGTEGFAHWTVPFDTDDDWPAALRDAVTAYRKAWRAKMDEVNACIAASAEQEELVDQPEVVRGVTRVSLAEQKSPEGRSEYVVEMEGVDIYNPVDNSIASTGAEKVAAWFLDGDFDGRTFCVTQAFFPDRSAWDKLARALNGKNGPIDAERFEAFSGTTSLPFPAGRHRCVAVKVIDPRGNEVMCVQRL